MPRRSADTPAPVSSPGAAEWIGATLVIVVACALAGYLGSLAAASPGDPSFVWPPAGIGLAAVLRLGRRALPGVLLGGIAATAQGVLGPEAVESAGLHGAAIVGIGVGAMLQALVAASLLKRFDLAGKPLLGFKDISLSFVLICAACLVGATIGTLALSAAGLVPLDAAARTWSTWWVGELAGILLFAPLALALARKDVVTGGLLLAVLSAGMGATYVASKQIRAAADDAWQRSVNSETNQLTATVLQRIESSMAPVYSVGVLFKSSSSVFDSEFADAVSLLEDNEKTYFPASLAVATSANPKAGPAAWEIVFSTDGDGPFAVGESAANDQMDGTLRAAIQNPGGMVIGDIVRDKEDRAWLTTGIAIAGKQRVNVVFGVVNLTEMIDGLARTDMPPGVGLRLFARVPGDGAQDARSVLEAGGGDGAVLQTRAVRGVTSGTNFLFEWRLTERFMGGKRSILADFVHGGGMLATAIFGLFVVFMVGQNQAIRHVVEQRTDALSRKEAQLRTALDTMTDGIYMVDEDLRFVVFNERYRELVDLPAGVIEIGESATRAIRHHVTRGDYGPGDPDQLFSRRVSALAGPDSGRIDMVVNGGQKYLELKKASTGAGAVVVVTDVTDVTRARAELEQSEEQVRLILESIGEGVFGTDLDGRISFANSRALSLLGYAQDEMVGSKVHALIHYKREDGTDYPIEDCPMWRAYATGEGSRVDDEVLWRKDGTSFPVAYSATPIRQGDDVIGSVVAFDDITERRKAENRLRSVIATASDGIIVIDAQGTVLTFSPAAEKIFGYSADEIVGGNVNVLMSEPDRGAHDGYIRRYNADKISRIVGTNREVTGRRKDGTTFPMDLAVGEAQSGGEHIFTGIVRDVTERNRTAQLLAEEKSRLQDILDKSPVNIAFSTKGKIHFANPLFIETFGAGPGDMSPNLYVDPAERAKLVEELARDGVVSNREIRMYDRHKQVLDLLITYQPINFQGEDGILGWLLDITARKRAEETIHKQEQQLRAIIDNIPIVIILKDKAGRHLAVNRYYETATGVAPGDVIGKRDEEFFPPDVAAYIATVDRAVMEAGEGTTFEEKIPNPDGTLHDFLTTKVPVLDEDGESDTLVVAAVDITERKINEQKLAQAYEIISSSITYASHIQRAVLTGEDMLAAVMSDHFVYWEPRDVVGGDIYWCHMWGDGILVILADCTGHGVPGAFMTLLSTGALDRAMGETPPGQVGALIQRMHQIIQITLNQHGGSGGSNDGLELGACFVASDRTLLTFAGARLGLFVMHDGAVEEIKGTKSGMAYRGVPQTQAFDEVRVPLVPGHAFYMASDGYIDQVGGPRGRMMGKNRFREALAGMADLPFAEQKERLREALAEYQGDQTRRDDVTVIGFRV